MVLLIAPEIETVRNLIYQNHISSKNHVLKDNKIIPQGFL